MNKKTTNYYVDIILTSMCFWLIYVILWVEYIKYSDFKFENNLWLNDIINALLVLWIAIFLPKSIWKTIENKKSAKSLLINNYDELHNNTIELVEYINNIVNSSNSSIIHNIIYWKNHNEEINNILLKFKRIWSKVQILEELIQDEFENISDDKFFKEYKNFRTAVTDEIKNKNFKFNNAYYIKIYQHFINFENSINKIKFRINWL